MIGGGKTYGGVFVERINCLLVLKNLELDVGDIGLQLFSTVELGQGIACFNLVTHFDIQLAHPAGN